MIPRACVLVLEAEILGGVCGGVWVVVQRGKQSTSITHSIIQILSKKDALYKYSVVSYGE